VWSLGSWHYAALFLFHLALLHKIDGMLPSVVCGVDALSGDVRMLGKEKGQEC
jgi:hypothetical protein